MRATKLASYATSIGLLWPQYPISDRFIQFSKHLYLSHFQNPLFNQHTNKIHFANHSIRDRYLFEVTSPQNSLKTVIYNYGDTQLRTFLFHYENKTFSYSYALNHKRMVRGTCLAMPYKTLSSFHAEFNPGKTRSESTNTEYANQLHRHS